MEGGEDKPGNLSGVSSRPTEGVVGAVQMVWGGKCQGCGPLARTLSFRSDGF